MLSYLSNANLQSTYATLKNELALLDASQSSNGTKNGDDEQRYKGLLEKKWTSVIRLQKKVCGISLLNFLLPELIYCVDHGPRSTFTRLAGRVGFCTGINETKKSRSLFMDP